MTAAPGFSRGEGRDDAALGVTLEGTKGGRGSSKASAFGAIHASPEQIARFVVLEKLGTGGMGVVYAAWDPQLDRRIALKLVRPGSSSADAQSRLVREAQAMARLNHPNVVSVFDVGTHDGGVWIAMEFVEGTTLRDHLRELDRDWQAILVLFRQAGAGLAAAHEAELIHRDFKPDNVLIGKDARVRVADFGLVRPSHTTQEPSTEIPGFEASGEVETIIEADTVPRDLSAPHEPELAGRVVSLPGLSTPGLSTPGLSTPSGRISTPGSGQSTPSGLSLQLTADGALLGTPRFMAPEQYRRLPVDARSDQFAFCVALYQALYGVWPFGGKEFFELAAAVTLGSPHPAPANSGVPPAIAEAVMRGLSRAPEDRFPTMLALLAALEFDEKPVRRWPWAVASAAVAAVAAGVAVWLSGAAPEPVDACVQGQQIVEQTWSEPRRAELEKQFSTLEIGFADSSLAVIDDALIAWTQTWAGEYRSTCESRHEQSAQRYDLRMACLSERREQVEGLIELFAEANAELVRDAPTLVGELPQATACATLEQLRGVEAPTPAQQEGVGRVRKGLARARARIDAARVLGVQDQLEAFRAESSLLGYAPLEAEVDAVGGQLAMFAGEREQGRELLLHAHEQALGLGYDRLALDTAHELIRGDNFGPSGQGYELAHRWQAIATGLERRLGSSKADEAVRRLAYGRVFSKQMRYPEAIAELQIAVELAREVHGLDSLRTAEFELGLAIAYGNEGEWEHAGSYLATAIEIHERKLSSTHPLLLNPLHARHGQRVGAGDLDGALADALRMQQISDVAYGPRHRISTQVLSRLGIVYDLRGEHDKAQRYFTTVLANFGEDEALKTQSGIQAANSLCFSLYKLRRFDQARAQCERSLEAAPAIIGKDHMVTGIVHNNMALIERAEGNYEAALAHDRKALMIGEARVGPEHAFIAYALVGIGESARALGDLFEARRMFERAVAVRTNRSEPGEVGEAECLLGQVMVMENDDPTRARELGRAGLVRLRDAGPNWAKHAATCAAWLEAD